MNFIEMNHVSKTYREGERQVHAVTDLSLSIKKGEFALLSGPSGSGKTSLLNLMGGLDVPTEGTISVAGCQLNQASSRELAQLRLTSLGFIFQAHNLVPVLSAAENAEYVMLLQGIPRKTRRRTVDELFVELGIDGLQERMPKELSGGQQQRVAIARALAAGPELILADEPTASLDSKTSADLLQLMAGLNEKRGVSIVMSSHDPMVFDYAKRSIVLQDGRLKSDSLGRQ